MKMSIFATAAFAAALAAGSAFAADLPSRGLPMPPLPPEPPMWSGFYVGLNLGATLGVGPLSTSAVPLAAAPTWGSEVALSSALATSKFPLDDARFIGGGQVGYNFQLAPSWVVGVEADIQGVADSSNAGVAFGAGAPAAFPGERIISTVRATKTLDYFGTARGRVGFLAAPTLLLYATGGFAYGGVGSSTAIVQENAPFVPGFGSAGRYSDTRVGWTVGGGLEWLFAPKWSLKLEYLYYDLGRVTYGLSGLSLPGAYLSAVATSTRFDGHVARAGLNYHFNWSEPAPIIAKY
jgi:outer membrane immunogenic protein